MTNKEILLEQMFANKWLNELTDIEVEHLLDMLATSRGFGYKDCQKEYEEKLRWIPIEEKLPENQKIIAKCKSGGNIIANIACGEFAKDQIDYFSITEWRSFL